MLVELDLSSIVATDAEHWIVVILRFVCADVAIVAKRCIDEMRSLEVRSVPRASLTAVALLQIDARSERFRVALPDSAGVEFVEAKPN